MAPMPMAYLGSFRAFTKAQTYGAIHKPVGWGLAPAPFRPHLTHYITLNIIIGFDITSTNVAQWNSCLGQNTCLL
jgi:hypothetical protein